MSTFEYRAMAASGQRIVGTIQCRDRLEAIRRVRQLGHHPIEVRQGEAGAGGNWHQTLQRINVSDLAIFTRQLSSLLKAGLPMIRALQTLREQCANVKLHRVIVELEQSISRDGGSLAEAMARHPRVFNPVYRGLVRAGEEGGNLVEVLANLAITLSRSAKLRGQVLSAFIYPAFLLTLGTVAVFVLVTFVIPRFKVLFDSFGQQLPLPTRVLIAVSSFMATWWWAVLAVLAVMAMMARTSLKSPAVRLAMDRRLLRLPIFGNLLLKLEIARIFRTLGALIEGGVIILEALRITGDTAKNLAVKSSFAPIIRGVSGGRPFADLVQEAKIYPPLVISLIKTGEDTGELPEMLVELSSIYEDEAERAVTGAVKLLEPILIVVMGGVIAAIVAAVILPVFQSNALVQ